MLILSDAASCKLDTVGVPNRLAAARLLQ